MSLLVFGSIALDTVETPLEERSNLLGGSASYAALAASFFSPVNLVGIVGQDFPHEHIELFKSRNINLQGMQIVPQKTFRWSGKYMKDMNQRETRWVELSILENFTPDLPEDYRSGKMILLGNIDPMLQNDLLDQLTSHHFIIADTMDRWISMAKEELLRLVSRVDMLILNEGEAREFTGERNLIKAGRQILTMGPSTLAIKKGEHGCLLFGDGKFFSCPAYPLEDIYDPTGAGDCFAGGLAGYLAKHLIDVNHKATRNVPFDLLRQAVVYGSVMASFNVESFSVDRLRMLTIREIAERHEIFRAISKCESLE